MITFNTSIIYRMINFLAILQIIYKIYFLKIQNSEKILSFYFKMKPKFFYCKIFSSKKIVSVVTVEIGNKSVHNCNFNVNLNKDFF